MLQTFSQSTISFPRSNFQLSDFSSTLLIPEKYLSTLQLKLIQHKGLRSYVAYLLSKYQLFIANGLIPGYSNVTTKYQDKGQNLQKFAFRPRPEDWAELKLYRISFGMSISAFFIYLLLADSVDLAKATSDYLEGVGISMIPNFDLSAKVFLWNKRTYYTTLFHFRKRKEH
ncbi:MAG TPA: DUF1564 family protein [Leptospiraceae bacterium]|nr:DUF1564 family protein [Leptospiraceae bacterium]HMW07427.1 DUF1564 family protein [Leptospiraceae bacterium]HMX34679.1 DUF1564 family protein [Leptospiraceae bacterium]HMY33006.1 DUF1564 family protein [Leptospiraceae bacterium]HMZ63536.1 DUF1564 family protein [Leptospiraceae bacterium]